MTDTYTNKQATRSTEMRTAAMCPRKARYSHLHPQPPSEAMEIGTALHHELERHYNPDVGPNPYPQHVDTYRLLLDRAIGELPDVVPLGVELKFLGHPLSDTVAVNGTIDLLYVEDGTLVIHDHKTTSGWKWAKTPEQLRHDLQLNLYASIATTLYPQYDRVILRHLQLNKRTNTVRTVSTDPLTPRPLASYLQGATNALHARNTPVDQLPKHLDACGMYGGCPYQDMCDNDQETAMSIWDHLAKSEPATTPIVSPQVAPDLPPPAPEDRPVGQLASVKPKMQETLHAHGIRTLRDLSNAGDLTQYAGIGDVTATAITAELRAFGLAVSTPTAQPTPTAPTSNEATADLVVLVGVHVTGDVDVTRPHEHPTIQQAMADVCKTHGVAAWYLAPYGEGVKTLRYAADGIRWTGWVQIDPYHPVDHAVRHTVERHATVVVGAKP